MLQVTFVANLHCVLTEVTPKLKSTGCAKKQGHRLMTIVLSILNQFKIFFTRNFLVKFEVKWISKIPPHLAYVGTLPCETLMSAKQTINDKLQGSVATYLRCGGVLISNRFIVASVNEK